MDKEQKAKDALALLDNPVLRDAFEALRDRLDARALQVKATDIAEAQDVIRCKQLLAGIERELKRFIADGKIQSITDQKVRMFRNPL